MTAIPRAPTPDEDLRAVSPSGLVRAGGAAVVVAGLLTALLGLQLLLVLRADGFLSWIPTLWMVAGVATIGLGWQTASARAWAAMAAIPVCAVLVLAHLAWLIFSFAHGLFSLLALADLPLCIGATVGAIVALPGSRRATEARRRLRGEGLDVGI